MHVLTTPFFWLLVALFANFESLRPRKEHSHNFDKKYKHSSINLGSHLFNITKNRIEALCVMYAMDYFYSFVLCIISTNHAGFLVEVHPDRSEPVQEK
jgi:hypothetical protein